MMFLAAFLGANCLTAAVRPEQFAADSAFPLAVIVIATLGFSLCFLFCLFRLIAALFGAEHLTVEEKKELYLRQKRILDDFPERGAITQAQYDKSFGDLTEKMGMGDYKTNKPRECPKRPHLS